MTAPLCEDCRHFDKLSPYDGGRPICVRPLDWRPVMAIARMPSSQRPGCFDERARQRGGKNCGPKGRFFERKEIK